MKLLVLAHTPPPLHGQSVMVQVMLDGLASSPGLALHHVNFRLSRDNADVGRWRAEKIWRTLTLAARAVTTRLRHGCDTLYYIPAPPGKRGALYRDWLVMGLCRPFFRRLVLHWHAAGLAEWLDAHANSIERGMTRLLLGRANLAIVLAPSLRRDAEELAARKIAIVPNGVPDPGPPPASGPKPPSFQALFLGLCSEEKGVFAAAEAILAANQRAGTAASAPAFTFVAAGAFPDERTRRRFEALASAHPAVIRHVGFVTGKDKEQLFRNCDCLLFPTHYAAEALPLVVLESLARDRPVIATSWRGLPDLVSPGVGRIVPVGDARALTESLHDLQRTPPAAGACRQRYLGEYQMALHLERLAAALQSLESP